MNEQRKPPSRSKTVASLVGLVALAIVGGLIARPKPLAEQLSARADDVLRCIEARNAICLANLDWSQSLNDLRITEETAARVIDRALFQNIDGIVPGSVLKTVEPRRVTLSLLTRTKSAREIPFTVIVSTESNRPIVPHLTATTVLFHGLASHHVSASGSLTGVAKLQGWREMAIKDREVFEALGLRGIYYGPEHGYMTWEQYVANLDLRIQRAREIKAGGGSR